MPHNNPDYWREKRNAEALKELQRQEAVKQKQKVQELVSDLIKKLHK